MNKVLSSILSRTDTESKHFVLGIGSAWLQFGGSVLVSFLRYALLFAYVPKQDLGLAILLMSAVNFLYIFDSTLGPGITTEVGRAWDGNLTGQVISSCRYIYKKVSVIFVVTGIAALPVILFFAKDYQNHLVLLALWTMFSLRAGLGLYAGSKSHVLTGTGWYYAGKTAQMAGDVTGLAVLFVCLRANLSVLAIGIAAVSEGFALWTVASWFFKKRVVIDLDEPPDRETVQRIKSNSLAILGNSVGVFLIYNTDNFFLARYVGLSTVADYGIAYKLAFMIPTLCNPFYTAVYPRFVNSLRDSNREGIRKFFELVRLNHLLATALSLGIIFLGRYAIDFWVGPGHYIGIAVLGILVATFMLDNIHYPHGYTFLSKNRPKVLMYAALSSGLLNLAFTAYLAPRYGAMGVAAGTLLAQLVCTNLLIPVLSLAELNYAFPEYAYRTLLPIASIWAIPAVYWIFRLSSN